MKRIGLLVLLVCSVLLCMSTIVVVAVHGGSSSDQRIQLPTTSKSAIRTAPPESDHPRSAASSNEVILRTPKPSPFNAPWVAAILGALIGFTLSALTRKIDNARDDKIRNDEREHEGQVRESTLRNASIESLARAKRASYKTKMGWLNKVLQDRQEAFEELTALRVLAAEHKSTGPPNGAVVKSFRISSLSFEGESLRANLVNLNVTLKVYSSMPSKATSRRGQLFDKIGRLVENCYLDVKSERDRASTEVALHKTDGKFQLEEELEFLMHS